MKAQQVSEWAQNNWWGLTKFLGCCVIMALVWVYGIPMWNDFNNEMMKMAERHSQYLREHPTPVMQGYTVIFEDANLKKVWVYNGAGMDFVNSNVAEGWHIAAKQTNYMACWNYNTCDEYILERQSQ